MALCAQNWFRASTNEVTNNKKKELESNGLQKDMKNVVPGKRRGRKPKEHHLVTALFPAETQSYSPAPAPLPPQTVSPAPETQAPVPNPVINTLTTHPAPVDSVNPAQTRDAQPPIKKRSKTKKAQISE